jgi:hypothetical protein
MIEPHAIIHGTTDFAADPPRDMHYRNTKRCEWFDSDGEQCEAMIRKTSTHCQVHAAYLREMQKWPGAVAPPGMELVCPPKMAKKWPQGVRSIFRAQWRVYWRRYYRRLISDWWELTR